MIIRSGAAQGHGFLRTVSPQNPHKYGARAASPTENAWVYDNANSVAGVTDPVGHLTTETAYWGGAAYTVQQKAFNVFGESLGETVTIPSATEGAVLGKSCAFTHSYTTLTGLPLKDNYPLAGGCRPRARCTATPGSWTRRPGWAAWSAMPRTPPTTPGAMSPPSRSATPRAWLTSPAPTTRTPGTSRLPWCPGRPPRRPPWTASPTPTTLAGNTLSQASQQYGAAASTDAQCYNYDALARLAAAWTATDNCNTTPTTGNSSMVGDPLASSSAYWTTWGFDTLGNRASQVDHATASGGTDTTTSYSYNGNGTGQPDTLTSTAASGGSTAAASYGYDSAGNMTSRSAGRGSQALSWDDAWPLTAITGGTAGNSSFVYDADGGLLLEKDPGATTLYLPGEQITLNTATQATTGIRYFTLPGGGTAYRTGTGTAYGYEIADPHGTNLLTLDYTAQLPTWRQQAPYGAPRGTPATWVDNRAFLDKPADPATGLDIVGARQYDPVTGRFTSVDPVLEKNSPQQLNGYSYAADNPVSNSDPTGLMLPSDGGSGCSGDSCDPPPAPVDTNYGGLGGPAPAPVDTNMGGMGGTGAGSGGGCAGCTAPGTGRYYTNDTPIWIPASLPEDYRPHGATGLWGDIVNGLVDDNLMQQMAAVQDYMWLHGWHLASGNLDHWLDNKGTPLEMSPKAMMDAVPLFKSDVMSKIVKGSFDSGWDSDSIANAGSRPLDYYYALNGYQYRVYGHGAGDTEHVTVDLFKRYNLGGQIEE